MFFKSDTIFKVYQTQKGADAYISSKLAHCPTAHVEVIDNRFFVVA